MHAFFLLEDAPAVESLNLENPESVTEFVQFWDPLVSAWNPAPEEPKANVHPSARDPLDMEYTRRELAQLLNRVQRHGKCTSYCLRRPKGAPEDTDLVCRFRYPQECSENTTIKLDDRGHLKIFPKRNDSLLNLHNATQILGWQANVDFSPITSIHATLNYIAKYCSKTETKSEDYHQIFNSVLTSLENDIPSQVVFQKLLSKLIVERDWTAQECSHLLLGLPLHKTSRQFKSLNLSWPRFNAFRDTDPLMDDDDVVNVDKGWMDRYEHRSTQLHPELADVSLLQIYRRYDWKKEKFVLRPRAPARVVLIWPNYIPDKSDPATYENWCRAKLQLHHPYFRDVESLRQVEGVDVSWSEAYANCVATCGVHDDDPLPNEEDLEDDEADVEDEFEEQEENELEMEREIWDWHQLASRGPQTRPTTLSSRLGKRDMDREFNWHHSYTTVEEFRQWESYLEVQKRMTNVVEEIPEVDISKLVDNQQ